MELSGNVSWAATASLSNNSLCKYQQSDYTPAIYNIVTCAWCYFYIFGHSNIRIDPRTYDLVVTGQNGSYPEGTRMSVDIKNDTAVSVVCNSLQKPSDCWKWEMCCTRASQCCQTQISQGPRPYHEYGKSLCPRTWDGFSCWSDSSAGKTNTVNCPAFLSRSALENNAYRACTTNGTWALHPTYLKEWTNYDQCHNVEQFDMLHKAGFACNIITILMIVPACIIFLYYKPLRKQNRIRLHLCLMVSSLASSFSMLLWELMVIKDQLESNGENIMQRNTVGCRILLLLTRYTSMASFLWMFIEGFHLHWLLVYAFSVPKSLLPYYLVGFGGSAVPVIIYAIIRGANDRYNQRCWSNPLGELEWIILLPFATVLLVNVIFLLKIVYILVKQLEPHPNEPSNFRRTVKAMMVLIPLFGLQFSLFVYHPNNQDTFAKVHDILNKIVSSLQGAFVAIIFCYCNKEVQGFLRGSCSHFIKTSGNRKDFSSQSLTMSTQFDTDNTRSRGANRNGSSSHMIPLRAIYSSKNSDDLEAKDSTNDFINGNLQAIPENADEDFPLNPSSSL